MILKKTKKVKAQVKMGETIVILFIFFFLLVFGAAFYIKIKAVTVRQDIDKAYQMQSVELSQVVSFLPDIECSEISVRKTGCVDLYKLNSINNIAVSEDYTDMPDAVKTDVSNLDLYYRTKFAKAKIEVEILYPDSKAEIITIYNNTPETIKKAFVSNIPVSVYDPVGRDTPPHDKYYFGVLRVTLYS